MSAPERPLATTLHRTWPFECVVLRAATPAELGAALRGAEESVAAGGATPLAVAARDLCARFGSGLLAAAIVADTRATLTARLRLARERIAAGAARIDADGVHHEREPRGDPGRTVWLCDGAHAVGPGLFRELAVWLPGFVEAFDRVAAQDDDPGRVADFLFGPEGAAQDAGSADAGTRARLALAAGGVLSRWLLRLLPPPARALGGPGAGRPWLDTRVFTPERLEACDLDAVAAPPTWRWDDLLAGLALETGSVLVHIGPGPAPGGPSDPVGLVRANVDGLFAFLDGLARLAAAGLPVDLGPLFDLRGLPGATPDRTGAPSTRTFIFQPRSPRFDPRVVTLPAAGVIAPARAARAATVPDQLMPPGTPRDAPPGPGDERAEIVLQHLETMRLFLDQHQAAVRLFYGAAGTGGAPAGMTRAEPAPVPTVTAAPAPGPMLQHIVEMIPGGRLTAAARYDVDEAVFLRQHTPNVSAVSSLDPDAFGLPVMPLTFSMEALAEAAALLAPGRVVTGFESLEAARWMTFERDAVDVGITAEVVTPGERLEVAAAIFDPADPRRVYLSGRVVLERGYPPAPAAPQFSDPGAVDCDWSAGEIYPRRGFHGPMLRAITRIGRHGAAGMTGELTVLPRAPLFASEPRPAFRIDPVLLDSLGMGLGIWTWRDEMNGVYPVPFRVGRIRIYGPPLPEGERLRMQVQVTRNRDGLIAADLTAARADGRLHAAADDWEDYVYRLPLAVHRIARDPFGQRIAAPVDAAPSGAGSPAAAASSSGIPWNDVALVEFPDLAPGFFTAAEGIWEKILAFYWLGPAERREWARQGGDPGRRIAWLTERAALKDAIRTLLAARGRRVGPYDLPIRYTGDGRPAADGFSLALAARGERVWAAAADATRGALGLAVEAPEEMNDAIAGTVFAPDELRRLHRLGGDWPARAWCAKRAAAAAAGPEAAPDLRGFSIEDIDPAGGALRMKAPARWPAATGSAPATGGAPAIEAATSRHGELVVALCRIPGASFRA